MRLLWTNNCLAILLINSIHFLVLSGKDTAAKVYYWKQWTIRDAPFTGVLSQGLFLGICRKLSTVPRRLLIAKLHAYGVDLSACELLVDYLSHRLQRVKIGIMPKTIQCLIRHRPCKLFCQIYSLAAELLLSGLVIMEWKRALINSNLWFYRETRPITLKLLKLGEKSVKALGVIIDNRLTFSDHLSAYCLKAARQHNALSRISKYLDPKFKSIIYNSFIRSNFEYCPLVWHFCGKTNNNKLEKIQERSLRILQDTYELSYEELLNRNESSTLLLHRIKLLLFGGIQIVSWYEC